MPRESRLELCESLEQEAANLMTKLKKITQKLRTKNCSRKQ